MSKRVGRSAKGEDVDFDLLETKQKMEKNKPRAMEVRQREDFVHTKRRSRGRRSVMQRLKEKKATETKKAEESKKTSTKPKSEPKPTASEKTETSKSTKKSSRKKARKIVKDD